MMASQSETYQKLEIAERREVYLGTEYTRLQQVVQQLKNEILLRRAAAVVAAGNANIEKVEKVEPVAVQQEIAEVETVERTPTARLKTALHKQTLLTSKVLSLEEVCLDLKTRIRKRVESVEQRKGKRMKLTATTLTKPLEKLHLPKASAVHQQIAPTQAKCRSNPYH